MAPAAIEYQTYIDVGTVVAIFPSVYNINKALRSISCT